MDKQVIKIYYRWHNDPTTEWEGTGIIAEYDEGADPDDGVLYRFEPGEQITGDKGEFTVTAWEPALFEHYPYAD
jgi:hypothetical protein